MNILNNSNLLGLKGPLRITLLTASQNTHFSHFFQEARVFVIMRNPKMFNLGRFKVTLHCSSPTMAKNLALFKDLLRLMDVHSRELVVYTQMYQSNKYLKMIMPARTIINSVYQNFYSSGHMSEITAQNQKNISLTPMPCIITHQVGSVSSFEAAIIGYCQTWNMRLTDHVLTRMAILIFL